MIRLSKLTDYAIVILSHMASSPTTRFASHQLAGATGVPEPTVAKILKNLATAQLVESYRGATGGYQLAPENQRITVRAVIEAIDGPIAITDCVGSTLGSCTAEHKCPVRGKWDRVNHAIVAALDEIYLEEMMTPPATRTLVQVSDGAK